MKNQRGSLIAVIVLVGVVVGGGLWWWKSRGGDAPATSTIVQPGGSAAPRAASEGPRAKAAPASLEVTVSGGGAPLAGAAVRLAPEDGEVLVLRTGADGVARADQLAPGRWQVSASAEEYEAAAEKPQELAAGAAVKVALALARGGKPLSGTVTDVNGGPIAGARIDAAKLALGKPDRAIATALTGPDGKYRLTVPEGQLLVAARSADYAAQSRPVEVGAAGATADFALVPGGAIEGVVLDEKTRAPVPGALVSARRERTGALLLAEAGGHHGLAGPDGKFRLAGLRPGVYELKAGADARFTKDEAVIGLGVAEQVTGVELLVGTGPVIRGKVVDERGAPVADATVLAISQGERGRAPDAKSDTSGAFVLERLAPGRHLLVGRGGQLLGAGGTSVVLQDRDLDGVVVRVQRGLALRGRVEPAQVAQVQLEPEDERIGALGPRAIAAPLTTGPDGRFELSPVAPGRGTLTARCPSGDQGELDVAVSAQTGEVVLRVAPGGSIAGRLTDGEGKPVGGVAVMATATGGTERATLVNGVVTSGVQALTNAAGAYEIRGLAAGAYRMAALERGRPARLRGKAPQVALGPKEKKSGVDFAIDRANGVISGVVLGPDGAPLADAWVSVQQDLGAMLSGMMGAGPGAGAGGEGGGGPPGGGGGSRMVRLEVSDEGDGTSASAVPPALTDASGKFELRGLAHGVYEVVAEAQAGKLRGSAKSVTPDATLTIQASGLTTLSGTVRGPAGPTALFTVELDGPTRAQRTFTGGAFELGRVSPGAYKLRVRSSDGNAEQAVTVAVGTPTTVDIVLVANAIVVGQLVDGAGQPVGGMPVLVVEQQPGERGLRIEMSEPPQTSGPDGRFRVEHKAGLGTLVVLGGRPITKRDLQLEPGKTLDVGQVRVDPAQQGGGPGGPQPPGPGPGGSGSGGPQPPAQLAPMQRQAPPPSQQLAPTQRHASLAPAR